MDVDQAMAARLRKARKLKFPDSAADAARAMNIDYPTYASHENGSRGFKRSADRYARFFGIRLDWLVNGRGEMKRERDILDGLSDEGAADVLRYAELIRFREERERGE